MKDEERFNAILGMLDTIGSRYQYDDKPHLVGRLSAEVRTQVTELMKWANDEFYNEESTKGTHC